MGVGPWSAFYARSVAIPARAELWWVGGGGGIVGGDWVTLIGINRISQTGDGPITVYRVRPSLFAKRSGRELYDPTSDASDIRHHYEGVFEPQMIR